MTYEGRMARGKENAELGRFLDNSETIAYLKSIETGDVDYSGMSMTKLKAAAKDLETTGEETKDDLIVLLENKSDEAK